MAGSTLAAYHQTIQLDINKNHNTYLDDILLFIAVPAFFMEVNKKYKTYKTKYKIIHKTSFSLTIFSLYFRWCRRFMQKLRFVLLSRLDTV